MPESYDKTVESPYLRERNIYLILIVVGILIRIPFFNFFDMVTYDGTYYIHDARSILGESFPPSPFPIGYPALIAALIPLLKDGVLAARIVSMLAGIGLSVVVYKLAREYVRKTEAILAAFLVIFSPLALRMSMITMSESLYVFWLFTGLLFFARRKDLASGGLLGLAAVTRPEALGVLGVLALFRMRRLKRLLLLLAGFSIVYSVNVAIQSRIAGKPVLISKTKFFGTHAKTWKGRENWLDSEEKETFLRERAEDGGEKNLITDYIETVPGEFRLLIGHVTVILFLLALYGIYRERGFLIASFVPFLIYPLFTVRRETRLVFPYIPAITIYAVIGLSTVRKHRFKIAVYTLLSISFLSGLVINRDQLTEPVAKGFKWAKDTGRHFREYVRPGDKIADRKPYLAFYGGGIYVEIPVAKYNKVMDYLIDENVEYLVCHKKLIHELRPALRAFLYDGALIKGEFRYSQGYFKPGLLALYKRNPEYEPLVRQEIIESTGQKLYGLTWSPDGEKIAYRKTDRYGRSEICFISPKGARINPAIKLETLQGPFSWSPDSKSIICSLKHGDNVDIYICHLTGGMERVTSHRAVDMHPFWSKDGKEIAFVSTRAKGSDIWIKDLGSGELTRITRSGVNGYPVISPGGERLAWIRKGKGLIVYDRSSSGMKLVEIAGDALYLPAWSPDGRYLMMTRSSWGSTNICLISSDGEHVLQLAGSDMSEGNPAWRPDGKAAAAFVDRDGKIGIRIISGMEHYFERMALMDKGGSFAPRAFKK
ncbi:MAG: glycosyltransferase family 39 protein [Candidatus Krumholzibacteriota bacterium]|nr:glycosyltransferase family 39 protein [Candidatus Krumholzibacteriota bacterium]